MPTTIATQPTSLLARYKAVRQATTNLCRPAHPPKT